MYQAPDFLKIDISVKDVYATYVVTGCPFDEGSMFTNPCEAGSPNYFYFNRLEEGLAHQCYSTNNP